MRATTEPTMQQVLAEVATVSHSGTRAVSEAGEPANDRPAASLTLHPTAGPHELLVARCAGYDVSLSHRHAAGSGNFEKRPRRRGQYGHGVTPGGGPDNSPAA